MNSIYANTVKKDAKTGLIIMAVPLLLSIAVMFLQSIKFASSLWVLLEFGHGEWKEYLWHLLKTLSTWAALTGVIFAMEFIAQPAVTGLKRFFSGMVTGFLTGFTFPYLLVFALGILIYIPLGLFSLFFENIIRYATLEFAWLTAAYLVFIWIAIDTPSLLLEALKKWNLYFKFLAILLFGLLCIQVLEALAFALKIIVNGSVWRTNVPFLLAFGVSLISAIIASLYSLKGRSTQAIVFTIVGVYIGSIVTGNISEYLFHWGELPSAVVAAFLGPIVYSRAARALIKHGINALSGIFGLFGGSLTGLLIDHFTKLRIVGQGWFGILCGITITIGFGVAFGLIYGPALINLLVSKTRIKPVIAMSMGIGLFLGIIIGMILGGFIAR
jgi:hypothetical protein